jgi:hypothetical membrane protein
MEGLTEEWIVRLYLFLIIGGIFVVIITSICDIDLTDNESKLGYFGGLFMMLVGLLLVLVS